jgi:tocopherol O-methyltransferase
MALETHARASGATQGVSRQIITEYYRQTWFDYRSLWLNRDNLAYHFGYWDHRAADHPSSLLRSNEILAEIAGIGPSDRVLDAGCGLGGSTFWLARNRAVSAVGIALGETQLKIAALLARQRMLSERVVFVCADFTACPFPPESFDVIWVQESLCHTPQKPAFYREAVRLLRPGGRLIVAEFMRSRRNLDRKSARLLQRWLDGWAIPDLDSSDEHVRAAREAGLVHILVRDVTARTRPSLRRLHRWARVVLPFEYLFYRLGFRSAVQHGNVVGALQQYRALRRQLWRYVILSARRAGSQDLGAIG